MTDERENAVADVQIQVARQITWFQPPDERHMDPVSFVAGLATVLVTAFLAGFQEEASAAAKSAGHEGFRWLEKFVVSFFHDESSTKPQQQPIPGELATKKLADEAVATVGKLDGERYRLCLSQTETGLRVQLEANLPPDRASALASVVRKAVETHIFGKHRKI
jgi:hypothetical protein